MGKARKAAALAGVVSTIAFGLAGAATPAFADGGGTVTSSAITVTPDTAGSNASYTIPFTVATALPGGDAIDLDAPTGTYFTDCTSGQCGGLYSIAVSGGGAATIDNVAYPDGSGSAENSIIITLGTSTIAAGETVTVQTDSSTTNPSAASTTYTIQESTTTDPTVATSADYTIAPSAPATVTVEGGNGQTATVSTAFKSPLEVLVEDAYDNPVPGADVTFDSTGATANGSFASCPANTGSTPSGACVVATNASGDATSSTLTANSQAGSYSVTATTQATSGNAQAIFSETNVAAPTPTVTGGPVSLSDSTAGATSNYTIGFTTKDSIAVGGTITLVAPNGTTFPSPSCTPIPISPCTNVTVTYTSGPSNDAYSATVSMATGPGATSTSTTDNEIVITVGSQLESSVAIPASTAVTVTVTGVTSPTAANPAYTIDESDSADSTAVPSNSYSVLPGPATTLTIVQATNNQSVQVTNHFSRLQVIASDKYGNPELAGSPVTFVLTDTAGSPGGTFPGATTTQNDQTDGTGTASSSVITANTTAGQWTAVAEIPNPGGSPISPVDFTLTNRPGAPTAMTSPAGDKQTTTVGDAYANPLAVTVTDRYGNPISGSDVTFSSPDATDATFSSAACVGGSTPMTSCTAATNSSGVATASDASAGTRAGTYQISATDGAATYAFSETNLAGPATKVVVASGDQQDGTINSAYPQPLVVQVQDQYANPVAGDTVEFAAPASPPSGTFGACAANPQNTPGNECFVTSGADGDATSSVFTADSTTGTVTVTATDTSVGSTPSTSFTLQNLSTTPATITAGSYTHSATVGMAFGTLSATVKDSGGDPINGANVTFTAPSTLGTFANGTDTDTVQTDMNGLATSSTYTASDEAFGSYQVIATPTGSTSPSASYQLTNVPGPPASLIVPPNAGSTPQSATVGTAFAQPLSAQVLDEYGNGVGDETVTFSAPTGSTPTGSFTTVDCTGNTDSTPAGECITDTASNGIAIAGFSANHIAGAYDVTATATSVSGTTLTYALTNTATTPAALSAQSGGSQSAEAGTPFADPAIVKVVDKYGNVVDGADVLFTVPHASGQPGALFGSTTTDYELTGSPGLATSKTFTADDVTGKWNLTAQIVDCSTGQAACDVGSPIALAETNTADTGDAVTIHTVAATTGQARQVGQAFAKPLQVQVLDKYGNPAPGVSVTFTLPTTAPDGTFPNRASSAVEVTGSNGVAQSPTLTAGLQPGNWTATASATVASTTVKAGFLESNTEGYWLAGSDGSVQAFGDAAYDGSAAGLALNSPVVGIGAPASGNGYYLATGKGGVFTYGNLPFYGSEGGQTLPAPIVGIASAPGGNGYWLVSSAGDVYGFGPGAKVYGSLTGTKLGSRIVGIAAAPAGNGYFLVSAAGGVFAYGSAKFQGSMVGKSLSAPVVGVAAAGSGYLLVSSNGGVFAFGLPFYGSEGGKSLNSPIVGIMAAPSGTGYWLAGHSGAIFTFGPGAEFEKTGVGAGEPIVGAAEG